MLKLNIMLIILQKCNDADIRLMYRCLNISVIVTKKILLHIVKMEKDFEKKECQNTSDTKLYGFAVNCSCPGSIQIRPPSANKLNAI